MKFILSFFFSLWIELWMNLWNEDDFQGRICPCADRPLSYQGRGEWPLFFAGFDHFFAVHSPSAWSFWGVAHRHQVGVDACCQGRHWQTLQGGWICRQWVPENDVLQLQRQFRHQLVSEERWTLFPASAKARNGKKYEGWFLLKKKFIFDNFYCCCYLRWAWNFPASSKMLIGL